MSSITGARLRAMDDRIAALRTALEQTGRIVAGVQPDQLHAPTPCTEWDVRTLLNHTVGSVKMLDAAARGEQFDMATYGQDLLGNDPRGAYDAAAARFSEVLSEPDVLSRDWTMAMGASPGERTINVAIIEMQQHGWDIARATGQDGRFDARVAQASLDAARELIAVFGRNPDGGFGEEVECDPRAPIHDRVAAFLGRRP